MSISERFLILLGVWALVSCGDGRDRAEVSYQFNLSPSQAVEFKSGLKEFALQNEYAFIDGSEKTREAREYVNKESKRSSQRDPGLVGQNSEIIDVTVEAKNRALGFLIFAKTSAYDAEKVSLTMIYNEHSAIERTMANNFSQSSFLLKWNE